MTPRLVIRNTPAAVVKQLKMQALSDGVSLSALVNSILLNHTESAAALPRPRKGARS